MTRVSFFYSVGPVVIIVGTAVLLTIPYLALLAFALMTLILLAGLGWAAVAAPYVLVRAVRRRWTGQTDRLPQPEPILSPVRQEAELLDSAQ
jgi:hypothetical protein